MTAVSGTNPVTGQAVGALGRSIAFVGAITPFSGGQIRAASNFVTSAAGALAKRIGRSSVSVPIEGGIRRVDLVGRSHGGVPTPHVVEYRLHVNPQTGASRMKGEFKGPATRENIIEAARAMGQSP